MTTTTPDSHAGSTRIYWMIGAILAVITIVEVIVAWPGLFGMPAEVLVPILLVLSLIKGAMVVMFFMHLKGDAGVFKFLFIVPFLMAVSMMLVFLALFSGHIGIAG